MGIPVTWYPSGKSVRLPCIRANPAVNSTLLTVKLWPAWRLPFMYGYAKLPKNLGYFECKDSGVVLSKGSASRLGASGSNTPFSCQSCWYFFSEAMRVSLFSVFSSFFRFLVLFAGSRVSRVALAALFGRFCGAGASAMTMSVSKLEARSEREWTVSCGREGLVLYVVKACVGVMRGTGRKKVSGGGGAPRRPVQKLSKLSKLTGLGRGQWQLSLKQLWAANCACSPIPIAMALRDFFHRLLGRQPKTQPPPFNFARNRYPAKKNWPPNLKQLTDRQQFRFERKFKRRLKMKSLRPTWNKWVTIVQWTLIGGISVYAILFHDFAQDPLNPRPGEQPFKGLRGWMKRMTGDFWTHTSAEKMPAAATTSGEEAEGAAAGGGRSVPRRIVGAPPEPRGGRPLS